MLAEAGFARQPVRPPAERGAPYRDHSRRARRLDLAELAPSAETKVAGLRAGRSRCAGGLAALAPPRTLHINGDFDDYWNGVGRPIVPQIVSCRGVQDARTGLPSTLTVLALWPSAWVHVDAHRSKGDHAEHR